MSEISKVKINPSCVLMTWQQSTWIHQGDKLICRCQQCDLMGWDTIVCVWDDVGLVKNAIIWYIYDIYIYVW